MPPRSETQKVPDESGKINRQKKQINTTPVTHSFPSKAGPHIKKTFFTFDDAYRDVRMLRRIVKLQGHMTRLDQLEHMPEQSGVHFEAAFVQPVRHHRQDVLGGPGVSTDARQNKINTKSNDNGSNNDSNNKAKIEETMDEERRREEMEEDTASGPFEGGKEGGRDGVESGGMKDFRY